MSQTPIPLTYLLSLAPTQALSIHAPAYVLSLLWVLPLSLPPPVKLAPFTDSEYVTKTVTSNAKANLQVKEWGKFMRTVIMVPELEMGAEILRERIMHHVQTCC